MSHQATGLDISKTSFEVSLDKPFSQARDIAEIMLMSTIAVDGLGIGSEEPTWPPVLKVRDIVSQIVIRTDVVAPTGSEKEKTELLAKRLGTWASQGDFEILPLPNTGDVGYRITKQGSTAAEAAFSKRKSMMQPSIELAARMSLR